jgi:hypothetical protein
MEHEEAKLFYALCAYKLIKSEYFNPLIIGIQMKWYVLNYVPSGHLVGSQNE